MLIKIVHESIELSLLKYFRTKSVNNSPKFPTINENLSQKRHVQNYLVNLGPIEYYGTSTRRTKEKIKSLLHLGYKRKLR